MQCEWQSECDQGSTREKKRGGIMKSTSEYAELAEKALGDANSISVADQKRRQLWVEAQVWASLAIAAANVVPGPGGGPAGSGS